jgi:hypothetical protein
LRESLRQTAIREGPLKYHGQRREEGKCVCHILGEVKGVLNFLLKTVRIAESLGILD